MNECIFCKIVKGQIPCHKIFENDKVLAFLDIACDYVGHTLVIPKQHCESVIDCDSDSLNAVMNAVQKISCHYVENCGYQGVNILNASGKAADQSVFHLHFHILPRKANDGLDTWPHKDKEDINLVELCKVLKIN